MAKTGKIEFPPEVNYSFTDRYVKVDGIELHYLSEGSVFQPTILFLHGNPTWSFLYRNIIVRLRSNFHCLALDYPGFGLSANPENYDYLPRSQAQIVSQFLCKLGVDKFSLFVHDWGGPIGLKVAGDQPELIEKLIITNTWAWPPEKNLLKLFSWLLSTKWGKKIILTYNGFVNYVMPWGVTVDRHQFKTQILPCYRFPFNQSSPLPTYIFPREILGSRQFLAEVKANLNRLITKSTLLLWAKWDPMFSSRVLTKFQHLLDVNKTVNLSAGHYLQEDRPEVISKEIKNFFSS